MEATLGGTIATNAAGAATFKYGATRRWVEAITVVLASGDVLDVRRGETFAHPDGYFDIILHDRVARVPLHVGAEVEEAARAQQAEEQRGHPVVDQPPPLVTPLPPGVGKVDVSGLNRMRLHVLDQEFAGITAENSPIGKFSLGDPLRSPTPFGKVEFDTQPVGFGPRDR